MKQLILTVIFFYFVRLVSAGPATDTLGNGYLSVHSTSLLSVERAISGQTAVRAMLGFSRQGRAVEAYYFPGSSEQRALIIAGVHGTELSGIEVARALVEQLQHQARIYYSVIVIPALFPDNAETAAGAPLQIGSSLNIGRYSMATAADPNRQMPPPGQAFRIDAPYDCMGREIEQENQLMLNLIQQFRPQRIVNIHAIRNEERAGVYADPRTDGDGYALGYEPDSMLAVSMAAYIEDHGGYTPGNRSEKGWNALYYCDPPVVAPGRFQPRSLCGSSLKGNRSAGATLGSWATTAVPGPSDLSGGRAAIQLITMEFPGCKRPSDYSTAFQQGECRLLVDLYARSIAQVFLADGAAGCSNE